MSWIYWIYCFCLSEAIWARPAHEVLKILAISSIIHSTPWIRKQNSHKHRNSMKVYPVTMHNNATKPEIVDSFQCDSCATPFSGVLKNCCTGLDSRWRRISSIVMALMGADFRHLYLGLKSTSVSLSSVAASKKWYQQILVTSTVHMYTAYNRQKSSKSMKW